MFRSGERTFRAGAPAATRVPRPVPTVSAPNRFVVSCHRRGYGTVAATVRHRWGSAPVPVPGSLITRQHDSAPGRAQVRPGDTGGPFRERRVFDGLKRPDRCGFFILLPPEAARRRKERDLDSLTPIRATLQHRSRRARPARFRRPGHSAQCDQVACGGSTWPFPAPPLFSPAPPTRVPHNGFRCGPVSHADTTAGSATSSRWHRSSTTLRQAPEKAADTVTCRPVINACTRGVEKNLTGTRAQVGARAAAEASVVALASAPPLRNVAEGEMFAPGGWRCGSRPCAQSHCRRCAPATSAARAARFMYHKSMLSPRVPWVTHALYIFTYYKRRSTCCQGCDLSWLNRPGGVSRTHVSQPVRPQVTPCHISRQRPEDGGARRHITDRAI